MTRSARPLRELLSIDDDQLARAADVGWRRYTERRFVEAADVFKGLAALDPEATMWWTALALVESARKRHDEAIDAVEKARFLAEVKGDAATLADTAALASVVFARAGRSGAARAAVDEALTRGAVDAPWRKSLEQGALELAALAPEEAVIDGILREDLAARLDDAARGKETLATVLAYGDDELLALSQRAGELLESGRIAEARTMFDGLVALEPRAPLFHLGLAECCRVLGDAQAARAAYDAAVEVARAVPDGADLVAYALERRAMLAG